MWALDGEVGGLTAQSDDNGSTIAVDCCCSFKLLQGFLHKETTQQLHCAAHYLVFTLMKNAEISALIDNIQHHYMVRNVYNLFLMRI